MPCNPPRKKDDNGFECQQRGKGELVGALVETKMLWNTIVVGPISLAFYYESLKSNRKLLYLC